jgi:hypothetical protein
VVVDLGVAQILERKEMELPERHFDADLSPLQRLKNGTCPLFFHDFPEGSNYTMPVLRPFHPFLDKGAALLLHFDSIPRPEFPRFSGPFGAGTLIPAEFPA